MVVVRLIGGLGNQLFQYALGRHLSCLADTSLKLDVTGFETYKLHAYSLGNFNIIEKFARRDEIKRSQGEGLWRWKRVFEKLKPYDQRAYLEEKDFNFDPLILKPRESVYLAGYWQSEKYFKSIEETLRRDLSITTPLEGKNWEICDQILNSSAVSVHIRRGDYVTNPATHQTHGVCSLSYYSRAMDHMMRQVTDPRFFLFSDDAEWARENLKFPGPVVIVDHNGPEKNYEDMRLMSKCQHHIIANSSFSWWGAWLNPRPGKIVLGPQKWFRLESIDTRDLFPPGWLQL